MTLGQRIKSLRKSKKITLRELSRQIGISISFLSDIENDRSNPSLDRLKDIAEGLEVTISYLLDEDNKETKSGHSLTYDSGEGKDKKIHDLKEDGLQAIDNYYRALPLKARKEMQEFAEYLWHKYKKK